MPETQQAAVAAAVRERPQAAFDAELVIVSYHSRPQLTEMLACVPRDVPIVLVDNASGADRVDELLAGFTHARYLDSGGGKGYAKAANLGARTSDYPYLIFGNPDSRPRLDVFRALLDDLRADPGIGAVAATTVSADGEVEIGVGGWEPTPLRTLVHAVGAQKLVPSLGIWARPRADGRARTLGWLSGACMAMRRDEFLSLGGWDESYFLYNEDMSLGRAVRAAGLRSVLRTDLLVEHAGGGSGSEGGYARTMMRQRGASMTAYLRDHNTPARAGLMRALLGLGYGVRVVESALRRRRERALGFVSYLQGLAFGRPRD